MLIQSSPVWYVIPSQTELFIFAISSAPNIADFARRIMIFVSDKHLKKFLQRPKGFVLPFRVKRAEREYVEVSLAGNPSSLLHNLRTISVITLPGRSITEADWTLGIHQHVTEICIPRLWESCAQHLRLELRLFRSYLAPAMDARSLWASRLCLGG